VSTYSKDVTRPTRSAGQLNGRLAAIGAGSLGLVGGIVGLIAGLNTYPPTAWFAAFEVGIPAAIAGGLAGLWGGVLLSIGRRLDRKAATSQVPQSIDA
jgi:hypothetical protein